MLKTSAAFGIKSQSLTVSPWIFVTWPLPLFQPPVLPFSPLPPWFWPSLCHPPGTTLEIPFVLNSFWFLAFSWEFFLCLSSISPPPQPVNSLSDTSPFREGTYFQIKAGWKPGSDPQPWWRKLAPRQSCRTTQGHSDVPPTSFSRQYLRPRPYKCTYNFSDFSYFSYISVVLLSH